MQKSKRKDQKKEYDYRTRNNLKTCDICGYETVEKYQLDNHFHIVHTIGEVDLECDFSYVDGKKSVRRRLVCRICGFSCCFHIKMGKHLEDVHEIKTHLRQTEKARLICDLCGLKFARKFEISNHMELIHAAFAEHECSLCDFKTNLISRFKTHSIQKHGHNEPNICFKCGKVFKREKWLRNHLKIHDEEGKRTDLICTICNVSCPSKNKLHAHTLEVHKNEEPKFVCPHCPKKFYYETSLKRHIGQKHIQNSVPHDDENCIKSLKNESVNVMEIGKKLKKCELYPLILFYFDRNMSINQTVIEINQAYPDSATYDTVRRQFLKFKSGNRSFKRAPGGILNAAKFSDEDLREAVINNPRLFLRDFAEMFEVTETAVCRRLKMMGFTRKRHAWVPPKLTQLKKDKKTSGYK